MPDIDPATRLARLKRLAALALVWEGLWPPLAFAGAVALAFAAASWFGLWFATPPYLRLAGLALFALAFLWALVPLVRLRWPGRAATLARLDLSAEAGHGPASAYEDRLANTGDDPATQALWALHKRRAAAEVEALRVKAPAPRLAARDPYALRFVAALVAVVAFLAAGPERLARLAAAFHGLPVVASAPPARVDVWINPPTYTGKPPIFVKVGEGEIDKTLTVPESAVLIVRADPKAVSVTATGGLAPVADAAAQERRFTLKSDGQASIRQGGSTLAELTLKAAPRTAPKIRLLDPPQGNVSGSLTLHYAIEDAYGVGEASGEAALAPPVAAHRLYGPPPIPLSLPGGAGGTGEARATVDLSEHPWAGAKATLTLTAKSVSQAQAQSPPVELALPQRRFVNPLAKALVELRRDLALDPDRNKPRVGKALAALRLGPDLFETGPRVFLDLDSMGDQLAAARSDDDLREVCVELWALALSIENGDASQALKDLRAAEEKLRDALKNGASPEELKKLTQELREAAKKLMAEMAKKADKNAEKDSDDDSPDSKDLDAMLDRLEKDAGDGAKQDAEAALDELQQTMENLRSADNSKPDPARKQMRQSMRDLGKLLKDQQALRNDTFREDQRERSGEPPTPDADDPSKDLEQRQQSLDDRLKDIEKQLRGAGVDTPKNLDEAKGDMGQAEQDLKGDNDQGKSRRRLGHTSKGDAVEEQGKAIEALRQGGDALAQQMRGKGKGMNGYVGKSGGSRGQNNDPLGRGKDGMKGAAEGELSGGADSAARARRVLDELRRRLSDPNRPTEERDYLERLIGQP